MVVATRVLLTGFVLVLVKVVVLIEISASAFLGTLVFLPTSEVLTDLFFLVAVMAGLLVTLFLVEIAVLGLVTVLDFVMTLLVLLPAGRLTLGILAFLPISEVLTDVIVLVLVVDGCLVTAFLAGVEAFGFVTVLDFVIVLLLLLAGAFRVAFGLVVFISLVLVVDILLAAKLFRR